MISDDKASHLAHLALGALKKSSHCRFTEDDGKVLREIKRLVGTDARLPEVVEAFHRRRRDCFVNTHAEGSLSVLAPGERQAFLARYEASNEWMRAHCFPQRERLFDAEPPASHAVVQSDDTSRQEALALLEQLGWRPEPQPKG